MDKREKELLDDPMIYEIIEEFMHKEYKEDERLKNKAEENIKRTLKRINEKLDRRERGNSRRAKRSA